VIFIKCTDVSNLPTAGGLQNVNMATLSGIPASKVVCSGDALKSCTMGQENQATIDVQSAGPGQWRASTLPYQQICAYDQQVLLVVRKTGV